MPARLYPVALLGAAICSSGFSATTPEDVFRSIRANDLGTLQRQCADRTSIRTADGRGITPLHYAAVVGSTESVRLLLDCGADVKAKNTYDATPLILAAAAPEKIRLLLEAGADANAKTKAGRSALLIASGLPGGFPSVKRLIERGADLNAADEQGATPLIKAALSGDLETVQFLTSKGADVNKADGAGFTAVQNALNCRDAKRLKLLLRLGADVNASNSRGGEVKHGKIALTQLTPLILASSHGTVEQVRALLDAGAKVNVQDGRGMTPLMAAVASENQDLLVIKALIAAGADVSAKDREGESVLDWARKFGYPTTMEALEKAGAKGKPIQASIVEVGATAGPALTAGTAAERGLRLLHKSSNNFFRESGCVGCHHQPVTGRALSVAAKAGLASPASAKDELSVAMATFRAREPLLVQFVDIGGGVDNVGAMLTSFAAAELPTNSLMDAAVNYIAGHQNMDGSWTSYGVSRVPSEDSDITRTALGTRAIRAYSWPARQKEFDERIARARAWLLKAKPRTSYEAADRLLGLYWAGATSAELAGASKDLIATQKNDGGWAQNRFVAADAYTTGLALHALSESRTLPVGDAIYKRGVEFLLRTQLQDGSWHVRSKSPKFQPYFQSGFPHEHDQWISAAATAYAVMALAPAAAVR